MLGPLTVDGYAGGLPPRDRVVLAALAVRPGAVLSAERLADALWGERLPASWSKVVQGCVVRLRKALGPQAIETLPQGYRLVVPADEVDAQRFGRLVERSRELLTLGEPERASYVIGQALALWRGPALVDLEGWDAGEVEAGRLAELRLDAEELRLEAALRAGRYREVLAEAQVRVSEAPMRERRWALLALAQYQGGRQGEALRTLHRVRTVLASELGLDPGPDLVALEQAILRQDPSLVAEAALPEPSATCPYLGLMPYGIDDADTFFGRDADVAVCLRRLARVGVLAVMGPSGSGKSSLVRAGVSAALQRDGRRVVVVTPGAHPMDALTVLPASGPAPVLVVDQCEETVTLCDDATEQARFFAALAEHAERGQLVLALRADRLGAVSDHPRFARLLERGLYLLSGMAEADLRAAIEGPSRQAGFALEPGLVDLLVREVEGEPGALPLLSHALHETWQQREGRTLTVAGYRATGGIRGAVAHSAEELYERVAPEQRPLLRQLLLRLVVPTAGGEPVRSRMPRRLVITDPTHERLLEMLVGARLVTSDEGVVELAHEALARAWPRLQGWLDDDTEGQRILRHLAVAADTWEGLGRPESELYRGVRLAQAMDWRGHADPDLTPTERAFLDAARQLAETERQAAEDRARQEARTNRRLRAMLTGLAVVLVAAIVASGLFVTQRSVAEREARAAQAAALGSSALLTDRLDHALLLAVEARHIDDSAQTRDTLLAALLREPELTDLGVNEGEPGWYKPALQPGGALMAVYLWGSPSAVVDLYDRDSVDRVGQLRLPGATDAHFIFDAVWRPDGETLAVVMVHLTPRAETSRVVWFDVASGAVTAERELETATLSGIAYHPDGTLYGTTVHGELLRFGVAGSEPEVLTEPAWFLDTTVPELVVPPFLALTAQGDRAVVSWPEHETIVYDLAGGPPVRFDGGGPFVLHPDGRRMIHVDPLGVRVRDLANGQELRRFASAATDSEDLSAYLWPALDADASRLAAFRQSDQIIQVWELETGLPLAELHPLRPPGGLAFDDNDEDDDRIIASDDAAIGVWDLTQASPVTATLSRGDDTHLAVTPDGTHTVSAGGEGEVLVRDLVQGEDRRHPVPGGGVTSLALRPDGRVVATAGVDGSVALLDLERGALVWEPVAPHPAHNRGYLATIGAIAFTPDGRYLLTAGWDGRVAVLDATTGQRVQDVTGAGASTPDDGSLHLMRVAPDGSKVAAFYDGRELVMWDWPSRHKRYNAPFPESGFSAVFSPDGRQLLVGDIEGQLHRIDTTDGGRIGAPLPLHNGAITSLAFSPDGRTIASASEEGTAQLVDTATFRAIGTPLQLGAGDLSVAFLPDGDRLVVGQERSTTSALLWDLDPDRWEARACELAGRDLSPDEWAALMPDRHPRPICGR